MVTQTKVKKHAKETTQDAAAKAFAALGEAKRLGIIGQLASGEQCACDLTACCGDRQPLLSFHLKKLREAGLVKARKEGRWMHYSLDTDRITALSDALARLAEGDVTAIEFDGFDRGGCC